MGRWDSERPSVDMISFPVVFNDIDAQYGPTVVRQAKQVFPVTFNLTLPLQRKFRSHPRGSDDRTSKQMAWNQRHCRMQSAIIVCETGAAASHRPVRQPAGESVLSESRTREPHRPIGRSLYTQ